MSSRDIGRRIDGRMIGFRFPIFLPWLFLPQFSFRTSDSQAKSMDRNMDDMKMKNLSADIFLSLIFLS